MVAVGTVASLTIAAEKAWDQALKTREAKDVAAFLVELCPIVEKMLGGSPLKLKEGAVLEQLATASGLEKDDIIQELPSLDQLARGGGSHHAGLYPLVAQIGGTYYSSKFAFRFSGSPRDTTHALN